jgi:ABC-2 type transport system ATP-binding protein
VTDPELAIRVRGLRKAYGPIQAVRDLDLEVARGEVFALLGPNGAGKTTTVEILEGYRARDAGEVSVLGIDPAEHAARLKQRVGIVLQSTGLPGYLTVAEVVEMDAGYYPRPRDVDEVIALVGLTQARDRRVNQLSGGQRRRVDLALALAGDPELLFLDEPTTGFDPSARRQAWDVVRDLAGLGKTILLTTHYMDEAQELANRVAIIADGRIVAQGTPESLGGRDAGQTIIRFSLPDARPLPGRFGAHQVGATHEIRSETPTRTLHELTEWALSEGAELAGIQVSRPSLEEVYLQLTASAEAA